MDTLLWCGCSSWAKEPRSERPKGGCLPSLSHQDREIANRVDSNQNPRRDILYVPIISVLFCKLPSCALLLSSKWADNETYFRRQL